MSSVPDFLPIGNVPMPIPGLPNQADLDPRLTRTHYFDGRLLTAGDLTRDQDYLDQRLREVGRALGSGVVRGLVATLVGGFIQVTPGVGISVDGRVMELKYPLQVDLNERARIAEQNKGQFSRLPRGLYAVVMIYAEEPRGVAEVFPKDLGAERAGQAATITEGVQLSLISLPLQLPQTDALKVTGGLSVRAALMRTLIDGNLAATIVPEDGVALGVLAIRDDTPEWLDQTLLRHPARTAPGPGDLQADLARQYEALLGDVLDQRGGSGADFAAADYFRVLPPAGPLPKAAIDPETGRQGYFPKDYRVWAAPIRAADLDLVRQESLRLPAIDLAADEPLEVVVLAPLSDTDYGRLAASLERRPPSALTATFGTQPLLAHLDLLALRLYPILPVHAIDTDRTAWREIWSRVGERAPVYVRRPTRAAETGISGIVLALGTQVPAPPRPGDLDTPTEPGPTPPLIPPRPTEPGPTPPLIPPRPTTPAAAPVVPVRDPGAALLEQVNFKRLAQLRRPDEESQEPFRRLADELGGEPAIVLAAMDLLVLVERRYDPALWPTLAALGKDLPRFRDALAEQLAAVERAVLTSTLVMRLGSDLGLDESTLSLWAKIDDQ